MSDIQPEATQEGDAPDVGQKAHEFLTGVLERMSIDADVTVTELDDKIVLDIDCDNIERIIGRRGQVVDALQHLVGKAVSRGRIGRRGKPVVVDAGGYRERHIERLQQLARRMSEKAIEKNIEVALNPMTPHDRRIVHMEIAEIGGVRTESEGAGDQRHVVIIPDGDVSAAVAEDSAPESAEPQPEEG